MFTGTYTMFLTLEMDLMLSKATVIVLLMTISGTMLLLPEITVTHTA